MILQQSEQCSLGVTMQSWGHAVLGSSLGKSWGHGKSWGQVLPFKQVLGSGLAFQHPKRVIQQVNYR